MLRKIIAGFLSAGIAVSPAAAQQEQDGVVVTGITDWEGIDTGINKDVAHFGLRINGKTYPYAEMPCGNILLWNGVNLDYTRKDFEGVEKLQTLFNQMGIPADAAAFDHAALGKTIDKAIADAKVQCELHIS